MKRVISILVAALLVALLPCGALAKVSGKDLIPIHDVYVENLRAPIAGSTPEFFYTISTPEGQNCQLVYPYWHDNTLGQDMFVEQTPFVLSHKYSSGCMIAPAEGYYFADDCVYHFNGEAALNDPAFFTPSYFEGCYYIQSTAMDCISPDSIGDVNRSGAIDANDALLTLRRALELNSLTPEQLTLSDADHDFACTANDALIIMRAALAIG